MVGGQVQLLKVGPVLPDKVLQALRGDVVKAEPKSCQFRQMGVAYSNEASVAQIFLAI